MPVRPHALILAGGRSRRMGQDKASLPVDGETLLDRTVRIVGPHCDAVFLSVAHGETRESGLPLLPDLTPSPGPLGGLQAALAHDPGVAWLVVACDFPLLDEGTIGFLLANAEEERHATAFRNRHDGRAEPLCALYQPSCAESLDDYFSRNKRCARGFLESLGPCLLDLPHPLALENANRPEHLEELRLLSAGPLQEKEVAVTFYGKLTAEAPTNPLTITTSAATMAGLYEELRLKLGLSLDLDLVKPVLDDEFAEWTTLLPSQANVAFLPPFAGG